LHAGTGGSEFDLTDARDTPLVLIDSRSTDEYCLTVDSTGGGVFLDTFKLVKPCSYSAAQQFKYDASGRLVHIATAKCLTYPKDVDAVVNTPIKLAPCAATAPYSHQIWRADDRKALRPKHYLWAGLCLKVDTQAPAAAVSCVYASGINTWTIGAAQRHSLAPAAAQPAPQGFLLCCAARCCAHAAAL
jgi:hypothetical protein